MTVSSQWVRLADNAIEVVGTSVADERTFSILKFVTVQWPSLTTHLELRAAEQTLFSRATFTLDQAVKVWGNWRRSSCNVSSRTICDAVYSNAPKAQKNFLRPALLSQSGKHTALHYIMPVADRLAQIAVYCQIARRPLHGTSTNLKQHRGMIPHSHASQRLQAQVSKRQCLWES